MEFTVEGLGFRVQAFGFRVDGSGVPDQALWLRESVLCNPP